MDSESYSERNTLSTAALLRFPISNMMPANPADRSWLSQVPSAFRLDHNAFDASQCQQRSGIDTLPDHGAGLGFVIRVDSAAEL